MTHYKGNKQEIPQRPKPNQDGGQKHSGAREGGEQVFADKAEKRARDKHKQEND